MNPAGIPAAIAGRKAETIYHGRVSLFSQARTSSEDRPRGDSSGKQTYVQLAVALRKVDAVDEMSANDKES